MKDYTLINQRVYDDVNRILNADILRYFYFLNDKSFIVEAKTAKEAYKIASKLYGKNGEIYETISYITRPMR
jgi:hypothetical protein